MAALMTFEWREVEQFGREFERLFYARDAVAMASHYTDDAKLMVEERPTMQGRKSIEAFWKATLAAVGDMTRTIAIEKVETSGNLGYLVARVTLCVPVADGQTLINTVKDITVWRREEDGAWRMAVDISNRNGPPVTQAH